MIHHSLIKTIMMDDRHEEGRHTGASDSMKFPCGLMCSLWCADFPHRLFGFSERENLGVLWCNDDDGNI